MVLIEVLLKSFFLDNLTDSINKNNSSAGPPFFTSALVSASEGATNWPKGGAGIGEEKNDNRTDCRAICKTTRAVLKQQTTKQKTKRGMITTIFPFSILECYY